MPATAACVAPRSAVQRRRQPERTLLYRTAQAHLATWLALHDEGADETAPAATAREFRRYLECGILAHGFARACCVDFGHDFFVAYSCLWPPKRQTSAAPVASGTDNGQS